jgi:uncharacterized protein
LKVNGTARLDAPAERVWAALNDPAVLVRTIPGCERLETTGADRYRMTVTAGVASIKGSYLGDVELADHVPHSAFTLRASGTGVPGTVSADVRVTLDEQPDGSTLLGYAADAVIGGTIGGVGQRVLGGVARRLAGEFFQAVNAELLAPATGSPGPSTPDPTPRPIPTIPTQTVPAPIPRPTPTIPAPTVPAPTVPAPTAGPAIAAPTAPAVFTRPAAGRPSSPALGGQLPAAVAGAAIALAGVLLGWLLARGRRP